LEGSWVKAKNNCKSTKVDEIRWFIQTKKWLSRVSGQIGPGKRVTTLDRPANEYVVQSENPIQISILIQTGLK
jgi:hypothetical protein